MSRFDPVVIGACRPLLGEVTDIAGNICGVSAANAGWIAIAPSSNMGAL
ncbi:MAG TPA: hypothetical protein VN114_05680 [Oxalicibacterium sp.]|nr:hypothetical protein [Oxalicibacterium sp.]HWU97983.1 hypothetical protein [Oxalicibacterium sp.]